MILVGVCLLAGASMNRIEIQVPLTQPGPLTGAGPPRKLLRIPAGPRLPDAQYFGDRRTVRRWPLSGLSYVPLIVASILFLLLTVFLTLGRATPIGLSVRLLRVGVEGPASPGAPPLIIKVESAGHHTPPRLYINWQPVSREDFDSALGKELRIRPPDWPVYVEGDPELDWREVATIIDRVRGHHAEVILLTRWKAR